MRHEKAREPGYRNQLLSPLFHFMAVGAGQYVNIIEIIYNPPAALFTPPAKKGTA